MDDLLPGWWVRGTVSYILTLNQSINRTKNFETFQMLTDPATGDRSYRRFGTKSEQNNSSTVSARRHQVYAEADRKSVVEGKSESVRLELGGSRTVKHNKKSKQT